MSKGKDGYTLYRVVYLDCYKREREVRKIGKSAEGVSKAIFDKPYLYFCNEIISVYDTDEKKYGDESLPYWM